MKTKHFHVLSIEDNPGDRFLIQKFFKANPYQFSLHFAQDGEIASDFLFRRGPFTNANRPDLILLDLNLPKKDGREILKELKQTPDLKEIPVVVFTTSKSADDKKMSLELGADKCITKPSELKSLQLVFSSIIEWFLERSSNPCTD